MVNEITKNKEKRLNLATFQKICGKSLNVKKFGLIIEDGKSIKIEECWKTVLNCKWIEKTEHFWEIPKMPLIFISFRLTYSFLINTIFSFDTVKTCLAKKSEFYQLSWTCVSLEQFQSCKQKQNS